MSSTNKAISAGISVVVVVVLALVGTSMLDSNQALGPVYDVESQASWDSHIDVLNGNASINSDGLLLEPGDNASSATYYVGDIGNMNFTQHVNDTGSGGAEYEFVVVDASDDSTVTSQTASLSGVSDNTTVELTGVDVSSVDDLYVEYRSTNSTGSNLAVYDSTADTDETESGILNTVGTAALGLLVILALLAHFGGVRGAVGRR